MYVLEEYKDKDGNTLETACIDLSLYCERIFQNTIRLLNEIEDLCDKNEINITTSDDFQNLRHRLFDIGGAIKRLPKNIKDGEENV